MKFYTYADPFMLNKAFFWNDIDKYPHLCVSEVLAAGLKKYYGRQTFNYIGTVDDFIKSFFSSWHNNTHDEISRYIEVSKILRQLFETSSQEDIIKSLQFNQKSVVEACKFVTELGLSRNDFQNELSEVQEVFFDVLKKVSTKKVWKPDWDNWITNEVCSKHALALESIVFQEIKEIVIPEELIFSISDNEVISRVERVINGCIGNVEGIRENINIEGLKWIYDNLYWYGLNVDTSKIVIHGLYRFTPLIWRMIETLENAGIEVIFLFNYNDDYPHIYETWWNVYKIWGKDSNATVKCDKKLDTQEDYNALGKAFGDLFEGRLDTDEKKQLSGLKLLEFPSMVSFANYVLETFDTVKDTKSHENKLSHMNEQFYGVCGEEVNEIIKAFRPELFGKKHFLSYPIGQFILGLYNMWDNDRQCLVLSENNILECLSLDIWDGFNGKNTPVSTYKMLCQFWGNKETTVAEVTKILNTLLNNHTKLAKLDDQDYKFVLNGFPFYSVSLEEIKGFINVLATLERIAGQLFNRGHYRDFKEHFREMIEILQKEIAWDLLSEEERSMAQKIEQQLTEFEDETMSGNIEDLRQTLHFFLNQKDETPATNWLIRNMDQIDGGILQAGKRNMTKAEYYHYAMLSDEDMKANLNDFIPWPLNENIFNIKHKGISLVKTVYQGYHQYLRCTLFQGLYYLKKNTGTNIKVKISFIRERDGEQYKPYYLFNLLGIEPEHVPEQGDYNDEVQETNLKKPPQSVNNYSFGNEWLEFSICPRRFMYNCVLDRKVYYVNSYHLYLYTVNSLRYLVRKKHGGISSGQVTGKVREEAQVFREWLGESWKDIEYEDIINRVRDFINREINSNDRLPNLPPKDMYPQKKLRFLIAQVEGLDEDQNTVKYMDFYRVRDDQKKGKRIIEYLQDWTDDGLTTVTNGRKKRTPIHEVICRHCNQAEVCLYRYQVGAPGILRENE